MSVMISVGWHLDGASTRKFGKMTFFKKWEILKEKLKAFSCIVWCIRGLQGFPSAPQWWWWWWGSSASLIVGTWCRRWGEQLATSGGSSLCQLMSTYQKENQKGKLCCVDCTRTMTQCMSLHASDQGFPNKGGVNSPSVKGDGKLSQQDLVYMVVGT